MNNLLLVEGIPGTGKTTTAKRIAKVLEDKGLTVKCFNEGDLHPCDIAWHSTFTKDEYNILLKRYLDEKDAILEYSKDEGEYVFIAYTKVMQDLELTPDHSLVHEFNRHNIYQGNVSVEEFKKLHFDRWRRFGNDFDTNTVYIFECAFMQNHITELILSYMKEDGFIIDYMIELIECVKRMGPRIVYLKPSNPEWIIDNVAKERMSDNPDVWPHWIDMMVNYVVESKYGRLNGLKTRADAMEFFKKRMNLESRLLESLEVDKSILVVNENDWSSIDILENELARWGKDND